MGFNLKYFFVELLALVSSGASHIESMNFIEDNVQYAKDCGMV